MFSFLVVDSNTTPCTEKNRKDIKKENADQTENEANQE